MVNCFLHLSLNSMIGWIFVSSPLLILDPVIVISVASNWDSSWFRSFDISLHKIFLSWWVHWIILNRSSWMQKYSRSNKVPSSFSGIPIKVHPSVLSNCNFSWSMINLFFRYSSYRARLTYFARNVVFDNCILFLICNFPHSSIYHFNSLVISSSEFWDNFSTPHWSNW